MRTKIFAVVFLVVITLFLIPDFVFAQRVGCPPEDALVPCGGPTCACTLCDFFVMIQRIINFALTRIVPVIAALMIIIAGAMMVSAYAGQSGPEIISRAKRLLGALVIGLLIVYLAWIIVNMFLMSIGVAEWTGLRNWWVIECQAPSGPLPPSGGTYCGDGVWQFPNDDFQFEECDGSDFPLGRICVDYGFASLEEVSCTIFCKVDTSGCEEAPPPPPGTFCGDGTVQTPNSEGVMEACDGTDLDDFTCLDFSGFTEPEGLACLISCQFDTSGCSSEPLTFCGDGTVQTPNSEGVMEACDGADLDDFTCLDFSGFTKPEGLACLVSCQFDTSGCSSAPLTFCGDNVIQNPNDDGVKEVCDGPSVGSKTCADFGMGPGTLTCLAGSNCLEFDPSGCGPILPPETGDLLWNCQFNGATMFSLAPFDGASVYLAGHWSINKIDETDGHNWYTTCQPGWYGTGAPIGFSVNLIDFASSHTDGDYIAFSGQLGTFLFFAVEDGQLVFNQDICTACHNNTNGLCDPAICTSLGESCRNISVHTLGGLLGNMCVAEGQCDLCGMVLGDICNGPECTSIGSSCLYNPSIGTCTAP